MENRRDTRPKYDGGLFERWAGRSHGNLKQTSSRPLRVFFQFFELEKMKKKGELSNFRFSRGSPT